MMPNTQQPQPVVAAIVWQAGPEGRRFLAVDRPPGKLLAGYWEFPGGKVDPGETLEQALARELLEELGIRPLDVEFWQELVHVYPHGAVRLYFFHVLRFEGVPAGLEGQHLAWLTPGAEHGLNFLPVDEELLAQLARLCDDNPAAGPEAPSGG